LRNSPNLFTRASCIKAAILATLLVDPAVAETAKPPLLVLLGGGSEIWQNACKERGWQFFTPHLEGSGQGLDERVKAIAAEVADAENKLGVDPNRVYLAAQGPAVSMLFFVASRVPDLWAAGVAAGGSPRAAIDTNRLFAANTANLPVLWLFSNKDEEDLAKKLQTARFNLEWRDASTAKPPEIFDWLAARERPPFPTTADCETGSTLYTHCYWIEITRFDPAEKNDVLDSTRVAPLGSSAVLAIGPFGYNPTAPGPGVLVTSLPAKYAGPLKVDDRILELGGKELKNGADLADILYHTFDEKPVVVMVARGKERLRLETKIVLAPRSELVTARVRAQFLPKWQTVEVVSRAITQLKLTLPNAWLPAKVTWNGAEVANATAGGCWLLDEEKELLSAKRCQ